jgi:hypothetical protein
MAPRRLRLSQRRKAAGSALPLEVPGEVWLDRAQFQCLTRMQGDETFTVPRSTGWDAGDLGTLTMEGRPSSALVVAPRFSLEWVRPRGLARFGGALVHTLGPATADSRRVASPEAIPLQVGAGKGPVPVVVPDEPRRSKRLVMGGIVLACAAWTAWALFVFSPTGAVSRSVTAASTFTTSGAEMPPPAAVGSTAAVSTSGSALGEAPPGAVREAASAAPIKTVGSHAPKPAAAVPDPHSIPSSSPTITRNRPPAFMPPPPPPAPMTPEEFQQWAATFRHGGEYWNPRHPGYPSHR